MIPHTRTQWGGYRVATILLAVLGTAQVGCSGAEDASLGHERSGIINGQASTLAPDVMINGGGSSGCTGSGFVLDGTRYVLTAAHCFRSLSLVATESSRYPYINITFFNVTDEPVVHPVALYRSQPFPAALNLPSGDARLRAGDFAILRLAAPCAALPAAAFATLAETPPAANAGLALFGIANTDAFGAPLDGDPVGTFTTTAVWNGSTGVFGYSLQGHTSRSDSGGRVSSGGRTVGVIVGGVERPTCGAPARVASVYSVVTAAIARATIAGTWTGVGADVVPAGTYRTFSRNLYDNGTIL